MNKIKKILLIILVILISLTIIGFIPNSSVNATTNTKTFYNLAMFLCFNDETDDINNIVSGTETRREIIDNTYNGNDYSLFDYYKCVSSNKVNLKTVYIYPTQSGFTSFKMSKNREEYAAKSETNPNGYNSLAQAQAEFTNEWTTLLQQAINENILPSFYGNRSNTINYSDLDSDNNGTIDFITVIFSPQTQTNFTSGRQDPLYPCMSETTKISINLGNKTLTSKTYNQWTPSYSTTYHTLNSDHNFLPFGTGTHEMGHCFGYKDLYDYYQRYAPVGNMSLMSDVITTVPQFLSGYEREINGWINSENINTITKSGTFTLSPVMDSNQTGIALYKIPILNVQDMWVYLEYRAFGDSGINKYDEKKKNLYIGDTLQNLLGASSTSGVVVYLVNKNAKYPTNSHGNPKMFGMEVLGGSSTNKKRTDAPQVKGNSLNVSCYNNDGVAINADISIDILDISASQAQIKITSSTLDSFQEITRQDINNDKLYDKLYSYNQILSTNSLDNYELLNFTSLSITNLSFLNLFNLSKIKYLILSDNHITSLADLDTFYNNHPNTIIILNRNNIDYDTLDEKYLNNGNILFGIQNLNCNTTTYKYHINSSFSPGSYQIVYESTSTGSKALKNNGFNTITFLNEPYNFTGYYFFSDSLIYQEEFTMDFSIEEKPSTYFELSSNNDSILINSNFNIPYTTNLNLEKYTISLNLDNNYLSNNLDQNIKLLVLGSHTVTINLINKIDDTDIITRTYTFIIYDDISPEIQLLGNSIITLEYGTTYEEAGISYSDNSLDGTYSLTNIPNNLSVDITITYNGNIVKDLSKLGLYTITYKVTDNANNYNVATRSVTVQDSTKPTVILNGDKNYIGIKYTEQGASFSDNYDQNVSHTILYYNSNDEQITEITNPGLYYAIYEATDSSLNKAFEKRDITILDLDSCIENTHQDITINKKYLNKNLEEISEPVQTESYYEEYTISDKYGNEEKFLKSIYPEQSNESNQQIKTIFIILIVAILSIGFIIYISIYIHKKNLKRRKYFQ